MDLLETYRGSVSQSFGSLF